MMSIPKYLCCLILSLLWLCEIPAFALTPKDEILTNLREPKNTKEPANHIIYTIGQDDVLGISVWQNMGLDGAQEEKAKKKEYVINRGDTLEISVWQWPDLIKDVIVRPDGKISFPLTGDIDAEGRTLTELDDILTLKLSEFIKSPQVSVMVKQFAGAGVSAGLPFIKIPDLSLDAVRVRPDGKISFPLLGELQAEGKTLDELGGELRLRVAKIVNNPEVFLQVNEFGGNKVVILGEVTDPGVYRTSGTITLLEALSLAGGYTKDAILRNVFVLRGNLNNPQVVKVNLSKAVTGRDFSQNIAVEPRDIVYVPKSFISDVNYVLNQLIQPLSNSYYATTYIKAIRGGVSPKK